MSDEVVKYKYSIIHNWTRPIDFDCDLFSIDKVYYYKGEVTWAERIFRVPAPFWLQKLVFGPDLKK